MFKKLALVTVFTMSLLLGGPILAQGPAKAALPWASIQAFFQAGGFFLGTGDRPNCPGLHMFGFKPPEGAWKIVSSEDGTKFVALEFRDDGTPILAVFGRAQDGLLVVDKTMVNIVPDRDEPLFDSWVCPGVTS